MKRWTCPNCGKGVLAPERPRQNDTRRYCLDCSRQSPTLVERVCDSLEKERAAKAAKAEEKRHQAQDKARVERSRVFLAERERWMVEGRDIRPEYRRIWRILHGKRRLPELEITRVASWGERGTAFVSTCPSRIALWLTTRCTWADAQGVLVHEIVHFTRGIHLRVNGRNQWHGDAFKKALAEACKRCFHVEVSAYALGTSTRAISQALQQKAAKAEEKTDA